MSDVRPVGTVDDEGFAAAAVAEGVDDVEGAWEAEGVVEERAPESIEVLDGAIVAKRGVKEVFVFISWRPCNSFLANIASWNK
jgi:hypothetical protein